MFEETIKFLSSRESKIPDTTPTTCFAVFARWSGPSRICTCHRAQYPMLVVSVSKTIIYTVDTNLPGQGAGLDLDPKEAGLRDGTASNAGQYRISLAAVLWKFGTAASSRYNDRWSRYDRAQHLCPTCRFAATSASPRIRELTARKDPPRRGHWPQLL